MASKVKEPNYEEDLDCIEFGNYKGIFFNDDPNSKYQDEETGAHFDYFDMCQRLRILQKELMVSESSVPEMEIGQTEKKSKVHGVNPRKGNAFQFIHSLLKAPEKESRNAIRVLPQQGYGTEGGAKREHQHLRNIKQFASQVEDRKKSDREDSEGIDRPYKDPARSKSQEKPQIKQNKAKIPLNSSIGPAKKCNLYELQRNIEKMLRNTRSHGYSRGMNNKSIKSNADQGSRKVIILKKSRNNASGAYDNKTYDYRAGVRREGGSHFSSAYHTNFQDRNSFGHLLYNKPELCGIKKSIVNHHDLAPERIGKIKLSLLGIERRGYQSRNIQAKSNCHEEKAERAPPLEIHRNIQRNNAAKRAYISSLLKVKP